VQDFAAVELAEIAPFEGSEPAHRISTADSVELTSYVYWCASIPITLVSSVFRPEIVVEQPAPLSTGWG
jgi:hypothetical protein